MFAYPEVELIEMRWRHPDLAAFPEPHGFGLVMDEYLSKGLRTQLAPESNDAEPWLLNDSTQNSSRKETHSGRGTQGPPQHSIGLAHSRALVPTAGLGSFADGRTLNTWRNDYKCTCQ